MSEKLKKILDSFIEKYELNESSIELASRVIEEFSQSDPSGKNKYVWLMMNIYFNENCGQEELINLIKEFHKNLDRISPKIFIENDIGAVCEDIVKYPKDIQNYKTLTDIKIVTYLAQRYNTKKDRVNKIITEDTDIVYEGDDYIIVCPLTFESSCYWGEETKWCTTSRENPNHFSTYSKDGTLFYIIDKLKVKEKEHPFGKFAAYIKHDNNDSRYFEVYNRPDETMGSSIGKFLPQRIYSIMVNYHINGGVINFDLIKKTFIEYMKNVSVLDLSEDRWVNVGYADDEIIEFKCENFPNFSCFIELERFDNTIRFVITWAHVTGITSKKIILKQIGEQIQLKEINRAIKQKDTEKVNNFFDSFVLGKLNDKIYSNKIKEQIYKEIISEHATGRHKDFMFYLNNVTVEREVKMIRGNYDNDHKYVVDPGTPGIIYNFTIRGWTPDATILKGFTIRASICLEYCRFKLYAGETDDIYWDQQEDYFSSFYRFEEEMIKMATEFKDWIVKMLETKTEKFIIDIYDDFAVKLISKSDAFDEYLRGPSEKNKIKVKPTEKSKQFFERHGNVDINGCPIEWLDLDDSGRPIYKKKMLKLKSNMKEDDMLGWGDILDEDDCNFKEKKDILYPDLPF